MIRGSEKQTRVYAEEDGPLDPEILTDPQGPIAWKDPVAATFGK